MTRLEEENESLADKVHTINAERAHVDDTMEKSVKMVELHRLCENELPKALRLDHSCRVERIHRTGPEPGLRGNGAEPIARQARQVIMRYLDFNDKTY